MAVNDPVTGEGEGDTVFHRVTDLEASVPTLIEGFPGHGLVASIAVDQIRKQLKLERHGTIRSETFPPVASFTEGLVQDMVRVYAGAEPDIMTLQSDVAIPEPAFEGLCQCVLEELADEFEQAIFLAAAPAESEDDHGDVIGVATTDELKADIEAAGIPIADGSGIIAGVTGALVTACYQSNVPAVLLLVKADPYVPDPAAARAVIEHALEPLVEFDIDTSNLLEQAETIQQQKQQVAQQVRQLQQAQGDEQQRDTRQAQRMFQ